MGVVTQSVDVTPEVGQMFMEMWVSTLITRKLKIRTAVKC